MFTPSPLIRQTTEAQIITNQGEKGEALNRKGEWGQNLPPKIVIEGRPPPPPPPPPRLKS